MPTEEKKDPVRILFLLNEYLALSVFCQLNAKKRVCLTLFLAVDIDSGDLLEDACIKVWKPHDG